MSPIISLSRCINSVFTIFSKAVAGSLALNFGRSGMHYCDASCACYGVCYATRLENIRYSVRTKLDRNYNMGPITLLDKALVELPQYPIPWFRLSTDGSVPSKSDISARNWPIYIAKLRILINRIRSTGALIHWPVESMGKARTYRALFPALCIRRSIQRYRSHDRLQAAIACHDNASMIVGRIHAGFVSKVETLANVTIAREYAKVIRNSGKTAIVCPAIIASANKRNGALCGQCKACADKRVNVVLYPFHA